MPQKVADPKLAVSMSDMRISSQMFLPVHFLRFLSAADLLEPIQPLTCLNGLVRKFKPPPSWTAPLLLLAALGLIIAFALFQPIPITISHILRPTGHARLALARGCCIPVGGCCI